MSSSTPIGTLLATANSFSDLHAMATFHDLRHALEQPLRRLWERGFIDEAAATALRSAMPHAGSAALRELLASHEVQRELKRRTASEVRRAILRGAVRLMQQPEPAAPGKRHTAAADEVPEGGDDLLEWAEAAGIPEALDAPAAQVLGAPDEEGDPDETIASVLAPDPWFLPLPRQASRAKRAQVAAARAFLIGERDEARRAVQEEAQALPSPEAPPPWKGLLETLATWRAHARRKVLPTTREVRDRGELTFLAEPPSFRYLDPRPILQERPPHRAEVLILVEDVARGKVVVACDACEGGEGCRHGLAAVDRLVEWTRKAQGEGPDQVARCLNRPPWERTVAMLRAAAGPPPQPAPDAPPTAPERLQWQVTPNPSELTASLRAALQKPLKRGGWSSGTAVRAEVLRAEDGAAALATAADLLAASVSGPGSGPIEAYGDRAWLALSALVGAPNVALRSDPAAPLRVQMAELGLGCRVAEGGFEIGPTLDGEWVDFSRTDGALPRHLVHHDAGRGRLLLSRVAERVARAFQVLYHRGASFPADAAAALAEELSSLSVPVTLPAELLGRECAPDGRMLVAAGLEGLSLSLAALVRPLPQGLTFPVGEGPDQVRARRGGEPIFTRRAKEEERRAAAALWESLGTRREEGAPSGSVRVEGLEALACLRRLEELERSGLEVLWPPERPAFTRVVRSSDLRVKVHDARFWFGLSGEVEVDGERLALAALLDAARKRERFVKLAEGRWAELGEELLQKVAPLADVAVAGEQGPEVTVAAAPMLEALAGEVRELEPAPRFGELLERLRASRAVDPPVPADLRAELRPYQREGFRWLARLSSWAPGACLADDMGLGKTLQALALLLQRRSEGPALVVAPTSVCFNWELEAQKFAPSLRVVSWHRCDRAEALSRLGAGDVLVMSYGLLARDLEALKAVQFGTVVLDEAQNIKNAEARRSRAARELPAGFVLALTGTPLENHLGELWSLYRAVFPGLLGSQAQFRERFQLAIERDGDAARRGALAAILRPFLLRRAKAQVATELPPRTEVLVPVALSGEERRLYEEARLAAVAELAGGAGGERKDRRFQVLAALTRLRLLACHPRLHDAKWEGAASKLERFLELVEELRDEGHRALVFSQFTKHLAVVREALDARGVGYQYLDGSTPEAERRGRVEAFQRGEGALFLISLKAGGSGLNLTAANHVIHLDPWWNPAAEDQATDRAHRIGQTRPVTVLRMVAQGTIEEQILALHGEKRALLAGVLEGAEAAAPVDVEELVGLLAKGGAGAAAESEEAGGGVPAVVRTRGRR